jgi:hypothetical protein
MRIADRVFSVVDRRQLDVIRSELDFQMSGEVDDDTAQQLGRIAGAQIIVSGAVSKIGDMYRLRIRALSVQTAQIEGQFNRNISNVTKISVLSQSKAMGYEEAGGLSSEAVPSSRQTRPRYEVFNEGMTWTQAKAFCESKGGHLVTITSEAEQREVFSLIADGQKELYWIGGQRAGNDWRWVTGEPWEYTNWAYGSPDNYLGQDAYVEIYRVPHPFIVERIAGKWEDTPIDNTILGQETFFSLAHIGIICEFE